MRVAARLLVFVLATATLAACGEEGTTPAPNTDPTPGTTPAHEVVKRKRWGPGDLDASGKERKDSIVAGILYPKGQEETIRRITRVVDDVGIPNWGGTNMGAWYLSVDAEYAEEAKEALRRIPELRQYVSIDRPQRSK